MAPYPLRDIQMAARQSNNAAREHVYNPQRFELSAIAPSLGLAPDADLNRVGQGLSSLIERSKQVELGSLSQAAREIVQRAFVAPEANHFAFTGGIIAASQSELVKVQEAVTILKNGVERAEREQKNFSGYFTDAYRPQAAPERQPAGQLSTPRLSPADEFAARLEQAEQFLREGGVIAPTARRDERPPQRLTERLLDHGLDCKWNERTQSWDPTMFGSPQPLFTASRFYFQKREERIERQLSEGRRIRPLSPECSRLYETCRDLRQQSDLARTAGVDLPNLRERQLVAWHDFFRATEPRS